MTPYALSLTALRTLAVILGLLRVFEFAETILFADPQQNRAMLVREELLPMLIIIAIVSILFAFSPFLSRLIAKETQEVSFQWHPSIFKTVLRCAGIFMATGALARLATFMFSPEIQDSFFTVEKHFGYAQLATGVVITVFAGFIAQTFQTLDDKKEKLGSFSPPSPGEND